MTHDERHSRLFVMTVGTIAILASPILVLSCNGRKSASSPTQHFALTIALTEPVGSAGDPLPDSIQTLSSPLEAKNCPSALFVPDVTIIRLDLPEPKPFDLGLGPDQNGVQRALGQRPTSTKLRAARQRMLQAIRVTPAMAQAGDSSLIEGNLRKLLIASPDRQVFTFTSFPGVSINRPIVHSVTEVGDRLGAAFCEKAQPRQEPRSFLVVYGGSASQEVVESAKARPTPDREPQPAREPAAIFDQLATEVQSAIRGEMPKATVDDHLVKAQNEIFSDYRFTYERAQLAVYGKEKHDEAFHHLFHAAEIAISNGDAEAMAKRLEADSGEEHPFHRLRHGHKQWVTLVRALATKNASLVRR